ncbi:MAG: RNA polymerase factor sigma-32 [Alphaproteobacteria bacterium]|jgi:RNA polymerase sigma-32 factor|nr:RNA polymerase factor sigma-32 [Alphaproteobacteria bacterium]
MTTYLSYPNAEGGELKRYLSYVSKVKSLTLEEEQYLAKDWFENKNKESAQKLIVSHLPLVVKMAYSYKGYGLSIMDLISEGTIGLMRSVDKFNPYNGNRLSTYAMWWIKAYMTDYILNSWSLVKTGTLQGRKKLFFSLNKIKTKLGIFGGSLSKEEVSIIAKQTNTSEKDVEDINSIISSRDLYISAKTSEDSNASSYENYLPSTEENPEETFIASEGQRNIKKMVKAVFKVLNDREKEILTKRYIVEKTQSLEEIGKTLGISRERVRQIEMKALAKAREFLGKSNSLSFA